MLEAIISFMPSEGMGAIGALDWTVEERKKLAVEVQDFLSHSLNVVSITHLPYYLNPFCLYLAVQVFLL